jgi:uncharacterized protein (TIGR02145 family)
MKTIGTIILALFLACNLVAAQDTLYIYKSGVVVTKRAVNDIDSVIFHKALDATAVVDIDGNVYHTVTIGAQTWMIENLKTTKYNDGTSIPNVTDWPYWNSLGTPGYCFYNNDVANKNIYGAIYNWYTVNTGKLAPTGWHVPTDTEWTTLENYLIANGYNYDGTTTGNKFAKSLAATSGWSTSTNEGVIGNDLTKNNTSGFTGLPGGYRLINGSFCEVGYNGGWWVSTESNPANAWHRFLNFENSNLNRNDNEKQYGFSVRCLRDDYTTVLGVPTLGTTSPYNIKTTSATSGGIITSDGGSAITARGVCWSSFQNPTIANSKTNDGTGFGGFISSMIDLTSSTLYYVRAYATNSIGTAYGSVELFTTLSDGAVDIDGNVYHTVTIGAQTWMVENLKTTKYNDGTSIPNVTDGSVWGSLTTPGYCFYSNDVANKNTYGALYNWYTVNTGKLAPTGWHVPTDVEWTTLENYLIANGYNYDGTTTGNKFAKSLAATSGWSTSTSEGVIGNDLTKNNTSGFSGLPGGYRHINGSFNEVGYNGGWWVSTESNSSNAWHRFLNYGNSNLNRNDNEKQYGFSVRCVRDH